MEPVRKKQRVVMEEGSTAVATPPPVVNDEPTTTTMDTTATLTVADATTAMPPPPAVVVDDDGIDELWMAHEKAMLELTTCLTELDEPPPLDTTSIWLQLKSLQRQVLSRLADGMTEVDTKRQTLERSSAVLDNILYEQSYWQQQIQQCQAFETPQLEQMCRDELLQPTEEPSSESNVTNMMNAFLCPTSSSTTSHDTTAITTTTTISSSVTTTMSYTDPHAKTRILAKLQQEIHLRGTLERDLKEWKRQLADGKRQVQSKQVLIKELPQKLVDMERASRALQRLFHTSSTNAAATSNSNNNKMTTTSAVAVTENHVRTSVPQHSSTVHLIGSERRERLDMAQQLPGPLYTLFVHLQHDLDATPMTATNLRNTALSLEIKPTLTTTTTTTTTSPPNMHVAADRVIWLHIPIPDVSSCSSSSYSSANTSTSNTSGRGSPLTTSVGTKKVVTVQFTYNMQHGYVTAKALGSPTVDGVLLDTARLLDQLFPEDTGDYPAMTMMMMMTTSQTATVTTNGCDDNDNSTTMDTTTSAYGKPYHWCNYIAGLHFPLEHRSDDQSSLSVWKQQQQQQQQQSSTRVVVRELIRRVRARAVLNYLLSNFRLRKPNPIPVHVAMESSLWVRGELDGTAPSTAAQLVKFQEINTANTANNNNNHDANTAKRLGKVSHHHRQPRIFGFTIQHAAATCQGTVTIDTVRYPAVPPVWSLQTPSSSMSGTTHQTASISSLQEGTNPIYDEGLAKLEQAINNDELETLIIPDMEETFDWILAHQMRRLIHMWDRWQSSRDASNSHACSGRTRRGRDRTSVVVMSS